MRCEIIDEDHPHYGERGTLTGEVITMLGRRMARMELENCPHGTDACYVNPGQVIEYVNPSRHKRGRKKG